MSRPHIQIPGEGLTKLCRQHGIRKLSMFGSVLRDDFSPVSDIDLLVEFEPHRSPGLFRLQRIERELSALLDGRTVDLVTLPSLSPRIRDRVLAEIEVCYDAA